MGPYPPILFAARVSKPLASFSVNSLCSKATVRARVRRAGGMDSGSAAGATLAESSGPDLQAHHYFASGFDVLKAV